MVLVLRLHRRVRLRLLGHNLRRVQAISLCHLLRVLVAAAVGKDLEFDHLSVHVLHKVVLPGCHVLLHVPAVFF